MDGELETKKLIKQEKRELRRQERNKEHELLHRKRLAKTIIMWIGILGGLFLIVYGMIIWVNKTPPVVTINNAVSDSDWIKGNAQSVNTLIEYSDFQCPACAYYAPLVQKLSIELGDRLRIAYRHFPLPNHKNAMLAALAAESAGQQGKFWEMHDLIFANQIDWQNLPQNEAGKNFESYAEKLNLNLNKFKADLENPNLNKKIEDNFQNGVAIGINATPTFFLNGKKLINPRDYESFKNIILGG